LLDVDEEHKAELRRLKELYNAVVLNRELNEAAGALVRPAAGGLWHIAQNTADMATAI